jgi:hypothetical protein
MLVLDQDMIDSVLAANARGLGVALPDNHSGRLVQTVAKHIERWVSLELQQFPFALALGRNSQHGDIGLFFDGLTSKPSVLMEALSLPTVQGFVNWVRRAGTTKQRKALRTTLGRIAAGKAGRPRGRSPLNTDVSLALEVKAAADRLERGFDHVRAQRRHRREAHYVDPAGLHGMGYNNREIEILRDARKLAAAANRLVAMNRKMKVPNLRARASRGRKRLTQNR